MSQDADFVDTMDTWLQARLESVHTTLPGRIQSYNPDTRMAVVVPGIKLRSLHGDVIEYKPIAGVPVVWPGCKRFSLIPASLEAGDGVMLHFSEGSIGEWLSGDSIHDPEDETRFSLHDCIAVPGLWQPSRVPGDQTPGSADFGLLGSQGEVLGGAGGKLDLRNETSDLRREMERLWDAIAKINTDLQTQFTSMSGASSSFASLAAGFTALASAQGIASTAVTTVQKPNVKGLLA